MRRSRILALVLLLSSVLALHADPVTARDCSPAIKTIGGLAFASACADAAEVLLDPAIGLDDAAVLLTQVAADVEAVEGEFALSFASRPTIYVLATTPRYAAALHSLFGYPDATARWVAENSVSFFEPSLRTIAVNWEAIGQRRPIAAMRHELTHLITLRACATRCDLVPAWLNEGQARLAEAQTTGSEWRVLRMRYEAASLVTTQTLLPLSSLVTQQAWNAITSWNGYYKYQEAARVMELLRADVGEHAIPRLYERIRGGDDVAQAYASLAGKTFAQFVAGLPERLLDGTRAPGIATASGTPEGRGVSYVLYGFSPESDVTIDVVGANAATSERVRVSPQGSWFGWLDASLPTGAYRITASSDAVCVVAVVGKAAGRRALRDPDAAQVAPTPRACARYASGRGPY